MGAHRPVPKAHSPIGNYRPRLSPSGCATRGGFRSAVIHVSEPGKCRTPSRGGFLSESPFLGARVMAARRRLRGPRPPSSVRPGRQTVGASRAGMSSKPRPIFSRSRLLHFSTGASSAKKGFSPRVAEGPIEVVRFQARLLVNLGFWTCACHLRPPPVLGLGGPPPSKYLSASRGRPRARTRQVPLLCYLKPPLVAVLKHKFIRSN